MSGPAWRWRPRGALLTQCEPGGPATPARDLLAALAALADAVERADPGALEVAAGHAVEVARLAGVLEAERLAARPDLSTLERQAAALAGQLTAARPAGLGADLARLAMDVLAAWGFVRYDAGLDGEPVPAAWSRVAMAATALEVAARGGDDRVQRAALRTIASGLRSVLRAAR